VEWGFFQLKEKGFKNRIKGLSEEIMIVSERERQQKQEGNWGGGGKKSIPKKVNIQRRKNY